jgi:uncharacterized RDD family membrane protein YckC
MSNVNHPWAGARAPAPQAYGESAAVGPMPPPPMAVGAQRTGLPISSAGKRFGAYLLEALLLLVTLGIGWLIWSLIVWASGQTPAKSLLGMRCVRLDTRRSATWGTMFLREFVGKGVLGGFTFGLTTIVSAFMILIGDAHEGIWDKLASTVVIDDPDGRYRV